MNTINKNIKRQFIPKGANVFYVDLDNKFMAEAKERAKLSNEKQQPVGSVIVYNGEIIASAFNTNPFKNKKLIDLHKKYCIRHMLGIPTGKQYWICPGCAKKRDHSEYKASKQLLKKGIPGRPIDLYMWGHWACCNVCIAEMEKIPVNNIYFLKNCEKLFDPKEPGNIMGKQFL